MAQTTQGRPTPGKVAVLAASGALVSLLPVPVVPRRVLRLLRGALAHDLCSRAGLALDHVAREILADPAGTFEPSSLSQDALAFVAKLALRRFVPLGVLLAPARSYFDTWVFGRLLSRWLDVHRQSSPFGTSLRVGPDEARRIRVVLDRATFALLRPDLLVESTTALTSPEDTRSRLQRSVDALILSAASVPERLERRIDAALDRAVAS